MSGFDLIVRHAESLLSLLGEEADLLSRRFDADAHAALAVRKAEHAEALETALEAVKGEGHSALAAIPAAERQALATRLETLQIAMAENERDLRHRAELSRGILNAVEGEARRAAGPELSTYGAPKSAPRRASSLAVNAQI